MPTSKLQDSSLTSGAAASNRFRVFSEGRQRVISVRASSRPSVLEEGQRGLALLTFACTRRRLSSRIAAAHCTCHCENSTARAVAHSTSWRRLRRCSEVRRHRPARQRALAQRGVIKSNFNYRSPAAVTAGLEHSVNRSIHCSRAPRWYRFHSCHVQFDRTAT